MCAHHGFSFASVAEKVHHLFVTSILRVNGPLGPVEITVGMNRSKLRRFHSESYDLKQRPLFRRQSLCEVVYEEPEFVGLLGYHERPSSPHTPEEVSAYVPRDLFIL